MKANLSSEISLSHVSRHLYCPDDVLELSRVTRMEQARTTIYETARIGAAAVADHIAEQIRQRQEHNQRYVISLAPGRSTRDVFTELVRKHKEEGLSFKRLRGLYAHSRVKRNTKGNRRGRSDDFRLY